MIPQISPKNVVSLSKSGDGVFTVSYDTAMKLELHPLALLFPPLLEDKMDALTNDIFSHGQNHAVVLYEGKILDGVHRTKACRKNSMDVKCVRFEDLGYNGTASQFVLSENNQRRHVDKKTLAVIEASILNYDEPRKKQAIAGKQGGKLGGRGHKKTLVPNLAQGFPAPKSTRRTRDQLAERTVRHEGNDDFAGSTTWPGRRVCALAA